MREVYSAGYFTRGAWGVAGLLVKQHAYIDKNAEVCGGGVLAPFMAAVN